MKTEPGTRATGEYMAAENKGKQLCKHKAKSGDLQRKENSGGATSGLDVNDRGSTVYFL